MSHEIVIIVVPRDLLYLSRNQYYGIIYHSQVYLVIEFLNFLLLQKIYVELRIFLIKSQPIYMKVNYLNES